MDSQNDENVNEAQPEYDTTDAESPVLRHKPSTRSQTTHAHQEESRTEHYIKATLQGFRQFGIHGWNVLSNPQFWNVSSTVVLAIVGVIAVCIYWGQLQQMKSSGGQTERAVILTQGQLSVASRNAKTAEETLAEIKKGSTDTHDLAVAAKNQAIAAKLQVGEMRKQETDTHALAEAAGQQATTSLASERGWVKITDPKAVGDVFWPPDGSFQLTVKYRLTNVGHSVITGIYVRGQSIAQLWLPNSVIYPIQMAIAYCDNMRKEQPDPKTVRTLFPGDDFWDDLTVSISKREMEIADKTWPNPYGNREKSVYPTLIGCVNYQLPFSKDIHQTRFIYDINWFRPPKPGPWNLHGRGTFPIGKPVPESEIDIRPHFLGGLFAD